MDVRELHDRALDFFAELVAGVSEDAWSNSTPCDEWEVRALVNHNVSENWWAAELLAGKSIEEVGDRFEGDLLADEPVEAYDASAEAVRRALAPLEDLDRSVAVSYGPVPARSYLEHRYIDLVVHGWDLAVATGQDGELPPELAESAYETMSAQREQVRESGAFADEVEVPEDADVQTKLLGLLGRDPARW
ncbi:MAG: TIGR03086 family metal-binding protein [Actinomycetota bacterium]|nr:TIGR03086 family metal-binding protein [Actinomycetota bacterium]